MNHSLVFILLKNSFLWALILASEHNDINNFKQLLTETKNPMHAQKYFPTFFVPNHKHYDLSCHSFNTCIFEVFDPSDQTWQVLPSPYIYKPRSYDAPLLVLEQGDMVCFAGGDFIFTLNLNTDTWTIPPDYRCFNYDALTIKMIMIMIKPLTLLYSLIIVFQS